MQFLWIFFLHCKNIEKDGRFEQRDLGFQVLREWVWEERENKFLELMTQGKYKYFIYFHSKKSKSK
jgi:hypothetical protein